MTTVTGLAARLSQMAGCCINGQAIIGTQQGHAGTGGQRLLVCTAKSLSIAQSSQDSLFVLQGKKSSFSPPSGKKLY